MSVASVTEQRTSRSGAKDSNGKRTYTRLFRVTTSTADDGPIVVWQASSLPKLGDTFLIGNDQDDWAFVKKVSPTRLENKPTHWDVVVEYETIDVSNEEDDPDNPDPDSRDPEQVSLTYAHYVKPVESALRIKDQVQNTTWGAVVNSANVPLVDPPLEKDDARAILRISRNLSVVDEAEVHGMLNTLNSEALSFEWRGLAVAAAKHEAKFSAFAASHKYDGVNFYWRCDYEIHIGDWHAYPLDMGMAAKDLNDDDGHPWSPSDIYEGTANLKTITDVDDIPTADPVLLDGNGLPLQVNTFASNAVFLKYQIYKEGNWGASKVLKDLPWNILL